MLPAGSLRVSAYHGQASLRPCHPPRVCKGAKPLRQGSGKSHRHLRPPPSQESVRLRRTKGLVVDSPQDEGCPPAPFHTPKNGGQGVEGKNGDGGGFRSALPALRFSPPGRAITVDCPYEFLAGMCRGAEPLECAPKSQIQNPKRVQGIPPCRGFGRRLASG
jgi:hypothetical protein